MTAEAHVPRTPEELSRIISERPRGWEYLLFAGALILELEPLESRYEDYKLGYAPRLGITVYESQFREYLQIQLGELRVLVDNFTRIFNTETLAPAFGPPGEAGDPAKLLHMAKRMMRLYDELLTWVERLRGTSIPSEYQRLTRILASFADQPIEEIRRFVDEYAANTELIMQAISDDMPISITHNVRFDIPNDITDAFSKEIDRLKTSG